MRLTRIAVAAALGAVCLAAAWQARAQPQIEAPEQRAIALMNTWRYPGAFGMPIPRKKLHRMFFSTDESFDKVLEFYRTRSKAASDEEPAPAGGVDYAVATERRTPRGGEPVDIGAVLLRTAQHTYVVHLTRVGGAKGTTEVLVAIEEHQE